MRHSFIIMAAGAVLAAVGLTLLLTYPLLIGAENVIELQKQWRPAEKDAFEDLAEGDQVIIEDTVAGVSYDQSSELTKVRFEGGSKGDWEFYFSGQVYDDFARDDRVLIKTEIRLSSGQEVLDGTAGRYSLEEGAISHRYTSGPELALGGLGLLGLLVLVAGVVLFLRGWDEAEADYEQEYEEFERAPSGHLPGTAAPAPVTGLTVACPTCMQPLMIMDPTRPLTVACPHCASPMQVQ